MWLPHLKYAPNRSKLYLVKKLGEKKEVAISRTKKVSLTEGTIIMRDDRLCSNSIYKANIAS